MAGTATNAEPEIDEGPPKKRIYSACQHCQSRKRRCDGGEPSCGLCMKLDVPCVYTTRRRRGPGKKNRDAEAGVKTTESSGATESSLPQLPQLSQISQLRVSENTATEESRASAPDTLATQPYPSVNRPTEPVDRPRRGLGLVGNIAPFSSHLPGESLVAALRRARSKIEASMDNGHFTRKVFAPFPPHEYLVDLEQAVIEDVQLFCPALSRKLFLELVDQQYAAGMENCADDPPRWAVLNSLFAAAFRWRTANDSFEEMSLMGWGYFKNAFALFSELVISRPHLGSCEAMLAMATFLLGTADAVTTSQIASSAARTAQILGLHRNSTYANLDAQLASRYRRVCWVTFILNTDVAVKYGLPSPFDRAKMTIELPDEDAIDSGGTYSPSEGEEPLHYLRALARLSQIRSRIHERLSEDGVEGQTCSEHHTTMLGLESELDEWKSSLPASAQPETGVATSDVELETPVVYLHFMYFSALVKLHGYLARLKSVSGYALAFYQHPNRAFDKGAAYPGIQLSYEKCVAAARATINLLRVMPTQSFVHLWAMVCYPVAACLVLLWSALEEPAGPEAALNVRTIGQLVQFVAGLQEEGCAVRNLLDGCSRFLKIAKYAVHTQRAIRVSRPLDEDVNVRDQLEAFRLKLSGVADWMHLAQGLLSNMPLLCAQARDVFEDILEMERSDGYGPLAPEVMKPHNNNFSYRSV